MRKHALLFAALVAATSTAVLAGSGATWSYLGDTGPEHWGGLSPDWAICSEGRYQSPIDISGGIGANLEPVAADIQATPLDFGLDGPTFAVEYKSGSWLTVNGMRYELQQFHFHHPSEHTLNGEHFPMEAHLVLKGEGAAHANALLGVFINSGAAHAMLDQFLRVLPRAAKKSTDGVMVNVGDLLPERKDYYLYEGSMTTPGCPQSVRWFVMEEPVEASQAQIDTFIGDLTEGDSNNRPIQPRYGRMIIKGH